MRPPSLLNARLRMEPLSAAGLPVCGFDRGVGAS